jgi:hypothetical protein
MASEEPPIQARSIPPRIAEAVAGIELVGSDLVDRPAILRAIEQIKGESWVESVREASLNPILEVLTQASNEKAEILGQTGNSDALKEFTETAKKNVEILSKAVDLEAVKSLAQVVQASKKNAEIFDHFGKSNAVKALEQLAHASKKNAEIFDHFGKSNAVKALEQLAHASMKNDEFLSKVVNSDALKAFTEASMKNDEFLSKVVNSDALKALGQASEKNAEVLSKATNMDALKAFSRAFESTDVLRNVINASVLQTIKKESKKLDDTIRLMKDSGWLLPTQTRGWWEFAPGNRAGSYRSGNPFMALIAALAKKPDLEVAVTMESAAFMHRLSEHPAHKDVIAVAKGVSRQGSLSSYRQVDLQLPKFATVQIDEIPVHSISGLLAAMAIRPLAFRDWPNVKNWLPKACELVINAASSEHGSFGSKGGLLDILDGRSTSAHARAAYFFKVADQVSAAEQIIERIPEDFLGPVYLGSRERLSARAKYDSITRVYDNLIDLK